MISEITDFVMKRIKGEREVVPTPRILKRREIADVITIRDDDLGLLRGTNISWTIGDWHPNAGFEWGYSGQGPTDFAANILAHFTEGDEEFSFAHRIEFREKFVATMPRGGGRSKKEDILQFIAEKRACA